MDGKSFGGSFKMETGAVSFQVPEDNSDNESDIDDDQHNDEIAQDLQNIIQQHANDDDDDSDSQSYVQEGHDLTSGELTFHRNINEKNEAYTSTPMASTLHYQRNRLLPHTPLAGTPVQRDWRMHGDYHQNPRPIFSVPETEPVGQSDADGWSNNRENSQGLRQTASAVTTPVFNRSKPLEKTRSNAYVSPNGNYGTPNGYDLLRHDSLEPTPTNVQTKIIEQAQQKRVSELRDNMQNQCAALDDEIRGLKEHLSHVSAENRDLTEERERAAAEIGELNRQVAELQNLLKSYKVDVDAAKEEKQEFLRELYMNRGAMKQMKEALESSTSWQTIDTLKSQNERDRQALKEAHESEMRRQQEQYQRETQSLVQQLTDAKRTVDVFRDRLDSSEANLNETKRELERRMNSSADVDRRREDNTSDILRRELNAKNDEVNRLADRIIDLEKKASIHHESCSSETSRLREELTATVRQNSELVAEHAKVLQEKSSVTEELVRVNSECSTLKTERTKMEADLKSLRLIDQKNTAELTGLREAMARWRIEMEHLKRERAELEADMYPVLDPSRPDQKENYSPARCKVVISALDELKVQMNFADQEDYRLREENKQLHSEVHLMKKVLKKLKKHITGNPSPSGDSGICTENKTDSTRLLNGTKTATIVSGSGECEEDLANRTYVRELIAVKADLRLELEREYQQQLDIDRQVIMQKIDAAYMQKLQQVLTKLGVNGVLPAAGSNRSGLVGTEKSGY